MSSREDANHFFTQDSYQDSVSGLRVFMEIKKVIDVTLYRLIRSACRNKVILELFIFTMFSSLKMSVLFQYIYSVAIYYIFRGSVFILTSVKF